MVVRSGSWCIVMMANVCYGLHNLLPLMSNSRRSYGLEGKLNLFQRQREQGDLGQDWLADWSLLQR